MTTQRLIFVCVCSCLIVWSADPNANGQLLSISQHPDRLNALESNPDEHPVFLLRLLKFKNDACQEPFKRYLHVSVARIRELGGEVIFYGNAKPYDVDFIAMSKVFGLRSCPWDCIVLERYRSRKDLRKLGESKEYRRAMADLESGLENTVVYALNGSGWTGATNRSKAETVPGPPEPPNPNEAVYMLNLLKFKPDGETSYRQNYARKVMSLIAERNGKVIYGLKPEQRLIGEEEYDRVILVEYPSVDKFKQMLLSEEYQNVSHHRTEAIEVGHLYGFSNEATELKSLGELK